MREEGRLWWPRDVRKPIQDELTHLSVSAQRKYQLRMRRDGRCTVCGRPATGEARSLCLKHLIHVREQQRKKRGLSGSFHKSNACEPQLPSNHGESAARAVKVWPVRFTYRTDGSDMTVSVSRLGTMTRPALTALLQTFLTTLTWVCATNGSPTEGWLTLTLSDKSSLWRVTRSPADSSSLRLVPASRPMPPLLLGATRCFGNSLGA